MIAGWNATILVWFIMAVVSMVLCGAQRNVGVTIGEHCFDKISRSKYELSCVAVENKYYF